MEWQNQMNHVMEYIENNLTQDIDFINITKMMNCSEWEFRRLFSFVSNMSISEYIRNRRLTKAIEYIQNGNRIIDVSNQFGYESQASFSRAFKNLHGISPSSARMNHVLLNPCPSLTFKLVIKEDFKMETNSNQRVSIIGGGDVGYAMSIELNEEKIHQINEMFWNEVGNEAVGTTALPMYGAFVSEEKCNLIGEVDNKKVLDIACGTGDSLIYISNQGNPELWGLDISNEQIEKTRNKLESLNLSANLKCSPMEAECGIPNDYFDIIYSVYGIGWTTDLDVTFNKIATYLKQGGTFIFSWSHPIHKCVAIDGDTLSFKKSYFDESWYSVPRKGGVLSLADRKISTYINALSKAGFLIDEMIEETDEDIRDTIKTSFSKKAKMLPVTFVIKAIKM